MGKKFSTEEIKRITGAVGSEPVDIPHYYASPFLDLLRKQIQDAVHAKKAALKGVVEVKKMFFR